MTAEGELEAEPFPEPVKPASLAAESADDQAVPEQEGKAEAEAEATVPEPEKDEAREAEPGQDATKTDSTATSASAEVTAGDAVDTANSASADVTAGDAVDTATSASADVTAGDAVETSDSATTAPRSDLSLSDRLKEKGLTLETGDSGHAALGHSLMTVSAQEQKQLFTPLAQQGASAVKAEERRRKAAEEDLLNGVKTTLKKWVQEVLSSDEKKAKLLEKGVLKMTVSARWSEGLHQKLKDMVATFTGKLVAASDKEQGTKAPAWASAAEVRQEKWLVVFDAAAFEIFMRQFPEVVEPQEEAFRECVRKFIEEADLSALKIKDMFEALRKRFGSLRRPLLDRAKRMAGEFIQIKQAEEASGKKRKASDGKGAGKGGGVGAKKARIEKPEDITWAEATLIPLGLKSDGHPVVKSPTSVAMPILEGLKSFEELDEFRELLKSTQIGKVVNAFRHHADPQVSSTAKQLVTMWKVAMNKKAKKSGSADKTAEKPVKPATSSVGKSADKLAESKSADELAEKSEEPAMETEQPEKTEEPAMETEQPAVAEC